MNHSKILGMLLFLAGSVVLMGIITAEALYPVKYTTAGSEISNLGATKPPNSVIYQPSSGIFSYSMLIAGCMALVATFYQHIHFKKLIVSIPLGLFGLGLVGIGLFSGDKVPYHSISSILAFLSGGVSAITCSKVIAMPFKYVGIVLGLVSLAAWFIAVLSPNILIPFIGIGGTERWVAYPVLLWIVGVGGYLMNTK